MTALETPCRLWTGAVQSSGYGSVTNHAGGTMLVHRREWERVNGPIPDGLTIDHLCFERLCLNTDHMEVVTRSENSRRRFLAQTHCKHGHPLSGDNLRVKERRDGRRYRVCITCRREHNNRSQRKLRDAVAS